MKRIILCILLSAMLFLLVNPLKAEESEGRIAGFGCFIGSPLGLTARLDFLDPHRIAFGIGDAEGEGFYFFSDYLFTFYKFTKYQNLSLMAGGGLGIHKYKKDNRNNSDTDETRIEIRMPIAVEYIFEKVPVGLAVHFDPCLKITGDVDFNLRGGVGAQFYF